MISARWDETLQTTAAQMARQLQRDYALLQQRLSLKELVRLINDRTPSDRGKKMSAFVRLPKAWNRSRGPVHGDSAGCGHWLWSLPAVASADPSGRTSDEAAAGSPQGTTVEPVAAEAGYRRPLPCGLASSGSGLEHGWL